MRHWKDQSVAKCFNLSKHTQSWFRKWVIYSVKPSSLFPLVTEKVVVTIADAKPQYEPCLTIHYTSDEILEGSSCCELLELIQTHSILVQKV